MHEATLYKNKFIYYIAIASKIGIFFIKFYFIVFFSAKTKILRTNGTRTCRSTATPPQKHTCFRRWLDRATVARNTIA